MQSFSTQSSTLDRLFGWWYAIAAPPMVTEYAPLRQRKFVRQARFTSIILLIEIIYHLFSFLLFRDPSSQTNGTIAITIAAFVVAALLNRFGKTVACGVLGFVIVEISICLNIVHLGFVSGGFDVKDLATISVLILPELIALSLFPVAVALFLCSFNCIFSVVAILFFPKTPGLVHLLATSGPVSSFQPVGIQCFVIIMSLLWVSRAAKEMKRADRAEEVGKLTQTLAFQQNAVLAEKQQLEENMQHIIAIQTQAANGDFSARVPLDQQTVLWSVAISLNNLLARLQLWHQDAQLQQRNEQAVRHDAHRQQRTEQAIKQLLYEIQRSKRQGTPLHVQKTGTAVDLIFAELSGNPSPHREPVELAANTTGRQEFVELALNPSSGRETVELFPNSSSRRGTTELSGKIPSRPTPAYLPGKSTPPPENKK